MYIGMIILFFHSSVVSPVIQMVLKKKAIVSHEMTLLHIYVVENSGYLRPVIFHLLLSVIFSQALIMSLLLTFKFSKAANCDFKLIAFPNPSGKNSLRRQKLL
jgi:hypothetical protein